MEMVLFSKEQGKREEHDEEENAFIRLAPIVNDHPTKPVSCFLGRRKAVLVACSILLLLLFSSHKVLEITAKSSTNNGCTQQQQQQNNGEDSRMIVENLEADNSHLHGEISKLKKDINKLRKEKLSIKEHDDQQSQLIRVQESQQMDHEKRLEDEIQKMSRQNLVARFGNEKPIHVKVEVESRHKDDETMLLEEDLIFEMGGGTALEDLPYTIHRFLDEVDRDIYNGYKLYHTNDIVVLQKDHPEDDDESQENSIYYNPPLFYEEPRADSSFLSDSSYLLCDAIVSRPGQSDFLIRIKKNNGDDSDEEDSLGICFAKILDEGFQTFLGLDKKGYHEVMTIRKMSILS